MAQMPVPSPQQEQEITELTNKLSEIQTEYDRRTPERETAFAEWQQQLKTSADLWTVLTPTQAVSTGGATLELQDDRSILAKGKNPDKDVYEIELPVSLNQLRGLRLEILPHDALPRKDLAAPVTEISSSIPLKRI